MPNYVPGHHDFKPGDPVPLEEMRRLDRVAAGVENSTVTGVGAVGDGLQVLATPARLGFWARITGANSGASYTFKEVQDDGTGTSTIHWVNVAGGMTGTAREVGGSGTVPADPASGAIAWVVASEADERWEFKHNTAGGGGSALTVDEDDGSVTVPGVTEVRLDHTTLALSSPGAGVAFVSAKQTGGTYNYYSTTFNFYTNNVINIFNTLVENVYDNVTWNVFNNTVIDIIGSNTTVWVFQIPLKIDSSLYVACGTKTVTGADLTLHNQTNESTWDNWVPPPGVTVCRVNGAGLGSAATLTGIVPAAPPPGAPATPANGQVLFLLNVASSASQGGPGWLVLRDQSSYSAAGSQIITPGGYDLYVAPGGGVGLWYDPASAAWRVLTAEAGGITAGVNNNAGVQRMVGVNWATCVCEFDYDYTVNGRLIRAAPTVGC